MSGSALRVGLLGGTFNPIHYGHLRAAEEAAVGLGLDRVVFIPAARSPFKEDSPVISYRHRRHMVWLATARRPGFYLSDVEGLRSGVSYTVETLEYFQRRFDGRTRLYFIIGLDAFLEVYAWKDFKKLFQLADFAVAARPGSDPDLLSVVLKKHVDSGYSWDIDQSAFVCSGLRPVHYNPAGRMDISSTDIRGRLARGESVKYLLPEPVLQYIETNGLYRSAPAGEKGRPH